MLPRLGLVAYYKRESSGSLVESRGQLDYEVWRSRESTSLVAVTVTAATANAHMAATADVHSHRHRRCLQVTVITDARK